MKFSDFKSISAIYKITNIANGKIYIGQSKNFSVRMNEHLLSLIEGNHANLSFLDDFRKFGEGAFEIEIIEKCNRALLLEREKYHIDLYIKNGFVLYNIDQLGKPKKLIQKIVRGVYEHR